MLLPWKKWVSRKKMLGFYPDGCLGVRVSSGWQLSIGSYFSFHMLPYKLLFLAGPIAHFGWPLFKFWLKAWFYVTVI